MRLHSEIRIPRSVTERDLPNERRRGRSAERGLRREERLRRKDDVNEDPDRTIDGRSEWMCGLCRGPERTRPVTQNAVDRLLAGFL